MASFFTILMLFGLGRLVWGYYERFNERVEDEKRLPYWSWLAKGLAAPVLIVTLFNTGWLPGLPPLLGPFSSSAPAAWRTWNAFFLTEYVVLWLTSIWWAAVSLAWLIGAVAAESPRRTDLAGAVVLWSLFGIPIVVGACWFLGGVGLSVGLAIYLLFLAHYCTEFLPRRSPVPAYSQAIGRLKQGKLQEAEWAIIAQLEKFQNDFQGWMLLAEVYAEHHGDMKSAEQTILELCAQENVTMPEISVALQRLADWYLKVADDPAGARFALEEICRRMPGTHMDKMARQRIDRLPATQEAWEEEKRGRTIVLSSPIDPFAEDQIRSAPNLNEAEARARAEECVAKLRRDPDDIPTREELARLYAEELGRPEWGVEQLELILAMPDQTMAETLQRLLSLAKWQMQNGRDRQGARRTLQRIVGEFPHSAQAFAAQRRLSLMDQEDRLVQPN